MSSNIAIGIDLGTETSRVAIYRNGKVQIISNPEGYKETPSEVAFKNSERLVGNSAKKQNALNPKSSVFNIKRLIGSEFNQKQVRADIGNYPFHVAKNNSNSIIKATFRGKIEHFTPEEITAIILRKMKDTAEKYLGHEIKNAVITVPACFNQAQRQATKDAAEIAGLNVLRLINEPTAAALAYCFEKRVTEKHIFLIFKLGAGSFDVSIIEIAPGNCFKVIATSGDTHLGGTDFLEVLIKHFTKEITENCGLKVTGNARSMRRLRTAVEKTKKDLSSTLDAYIEVDSLLDGVDFSSRIKRATFEELSADLFSKLLDIVKKVLKATSIEKSDIDEVVLVGGSTRIPKIQKLLLDFFDGKALNHALNPDEAIVIGAAIQAATLSQCSSIEQYSVHDVTPFDIDVLIGLEKLEKKVFHQNCPIPSLCQFTYSLEEMGTNMPIKILEKSPDSVEDYRTLCEHNLNHFLQGEKIKSNVCFEFRVDENGLVDARAISRETKNTQLIELNKERLSHAEIEKTRKRLDSYENEDMLHQETVLARHRLEQYVYQMTDIISASVDHLSEDSISSISESQKLVKEWLEENKDADKKSYDDKYQEISSSLDEIIGHSEACPLLPQARKKSRGTLSWCFRCCHCFCSRIFHLPQTICHILFDFLRTIFNFFFGK